jgi:feruloyl esterase
MSDHLDRNPVAARVLLAAFAACGLAASNQATAAISNCSVASLNSFGVTAVTVDTAVDVPAGGGNPEFCDVTGTVTTTGGNAPDGSAGFELQLPSNWNHKFLFWGVGGLAGSTYADFAANPVDLFESLAKGYATAITDTGHQAGGTDAAWALESPGVADRAKLIDYYHRATHQVTVAAKALVRAFYGAQTISHSYFDGCSNGGRQAMVEATRYPDDFDGIIAGAPFMDIRTIIQGAKIQKVQLRSQQAYIPASLLPMIDSKILASCDAADGVQDGLIQNPANCSFDPSTLACGNGVTSNCLTPEQVDTLKAYFTALRDENGALVYPGAAVGDLSNGGMDAWTTGFVAPTDFTANEPWGGTGFSPAPIAWQFVDHILKFIVERDPGFDLHNYPVSLDGTVDRSAIAFFDSRTEAGDGDDPHRLSRFIRHNGKLLLFHGFSDPALPAFRTVKFYQDLARLHDGYEKVQGHVRLFMVPDMQHCVGGPGPNLFDTLTALESWVEAGQGPDGIVAIHHVNNNPANPIDRSMPLCKYPEQAEYKGSGSYNDGTNWSCTNNSKLLELGPNGIAAGLGSNDD